MRSQSVARYLASVAALALLAASSCDREQVLDKAEKEYAAGRYREAVLLIRHSIKTGDSPSAELLFLLGKSWLRSGSEAEARSAFEDCRRKDASFGPRIARFMKDEALSSIASRDVPRGKRMIMLALSFQSGLDFGENNSMVGKLYLDRREYDTAIAYLERYLSAFPDAPGAAESMIDLASAYEKNGNVDRAISMYRRFQERYPRSRLASNALWELENLLLKEAENLYGAGAVSEAESVLAELAPSAGSQLVRERTHFLLGEISEGRGNAKDAVRYYREVVNSGSSGKLVQKAKENIERLEMSKRRK